MTAQLIDLPRDLDEYDLIPSGMYYETRKKPVLGIGLHVTAGLQDLGMVGDDDSAEGTNRWGARKDRADASWHVCVDSDSICLGLPDWFTAWHIVGFNSPLVGLEISNKDARWDNKPAEWIEATLRNAAKYAAAIVKKYDLPLRLVRSKAEVQRLVDANQKIGFVYHMDLNPENRRDPGATFPWEQFINYVKIELGLAEEEQDEMADVKVRVPRSDPEKYVDAGRGINGAWTSAGGAFTNTNKILAEIAGLRAGQSVLLDVLQKMANGAPIPSPEEFLREFRESVDATMATLKFGDDDNEKETTA